MTYELTAEVHRVGDVNQVSDSFRKRDLILTFMDGEYKQFVVVQATQDRCDLLEGVKQGDNINAFFNLRGREWTNPKDGVVKFFNSLDLWKFEKVDEGNVPAESDDLPF